MLLHEQCIKNKIANCVTMFPSMDYVYVHFLCKPKKNICLIVTYICIEANVPTKHSSFHAQMNKDCGQKSNKPGLRHYVSVQVGAT
jgi:hypothetical protein